MGEINSFYETFESGFSKREVDILETRTTYQENGELIQTSQEIAESAHYETKEAYLNEYGKYMSDEQIAMLESKETINKLEVISSEEYTMQFEDIDVNVLGHCDSEGKIYIKDISPEIIKHISTHETTHLCANRETYYDESGNSNTISGLRETERSDVGVQRDENSGINEGLTELYTMRELENRGEIKAASSVTAYSEAKAWAHRMETLVGSEKVAAAYFGNEKEAMINEFNRLNCENENAWKEFSRDIDILQYSGDESLVNEAKCRLADKYLTMFQNKYKEKL